MIHSLYVIQSKKDFTFYIGITQDLKKRLEEHNKGLVFFTKHKIPWETIYCESYRSRKDAAEREQKLKQHKTAWYRIKERIKNSILSEQN